MMRLLKHLSSCLALSLVTITTPIAAKAEVQYPQRPIKLIVPYPPGGTTDVIARNIAQALTDRMGVSVFVDNKAGAAGMIGMAAVAKATPDGYTLLVSDASIATAPSINKTMSFDPFKDLTAVAWFVTVPHVIIVNANSGIQSLNQLVDLAKSNPEKLYFSSGGMGSPLHLAGEAVRTATGINWVHVPYKGGGPAVLAVLSGDAQVAVPSLPSVLPQLEGDKLLALAVTSPKRIKTLPAIASVTELGFPDAIALGWIGLHAPTGIPVEIKAKLETISAEILKEAAVRSRLVGQGSEPVEDPSARAYSEFVSAQAKSWARIVKAAQLEVLQ